MKKGLGLISLTLALVFALAVPASAAAIITGDSFTSSKNKSGTVKAGWETDRYEPEEFDVFGGTLYIAVGADGYYKSRSADEKDKFYALQGRKLACETPKTNTWTATVKINIDDAWLISDSFTKKAMFSLELVDGDGNPIKEQPAIALLKSNSQSPVLQYANPKSNTGWGTAYTYINGDDYKEDLILEDGWHTLLIKANKGVISYYLDEKKLGNCTLSTTDVYPSFMKLNVHNYDRPAVAEFDNLYLYDGSYVIRQLSSSASDKKEERLEETYEKKRNKWEDKYTIYTFEDNYTIKGIAFKKGDDFSQSSLKSKFKISNGNYLDDYDAANDELSNLLSDAGADTKTRDSKEMPDSYWDY